MKAIGYPGKRLLDVAVSSIVLIMASPILLVVGLWIRLTMGGPTFFRQSRPGLHREPFTILKFRTMSKAADQTGADLPDAVRVTPLGRRLRRTSMDELPELFNVLRGDMSLVGPRPLLTRYLPYYLPHEVRRFEVRPGITGLAQVSGRNYLPWDERLQLDVDYIDGMSLKMDLAILWRTIRTVASSSGVAVDSYEVEADLDEERRSSGGAR